MLISAEIRWFWRDKPPAGLRDWFCEPGAFSSYKAGGGGSRTDEYLRDPKQKDLGIKRRGRKQTETAEVVANKPDEIEVKGLIALAPTPLQTAPFVGTIEIWRKWKSTGLEIPTGRIVSTAKRRWQRKFDGSGASLVEVELDANEDPKSGVRPNRGCGVELTEVTVDGKEVWWSFGFEAFGTPATAVDDLRRTALLLAERKPPNFAGGELASYPAWLSGLK